MKDFFTIKNLKFGLGLATGFLLYDSIFKDKIDWIRVVVVAILSVIIVAVINGMKKKDT